MYGFILTLHVLIAFALIVAIVVFQTSKGSALSMFGGGGDALFNTASGTSFIKKFTAGAAIAFACTSLLLSVMSSGNRTRSVVQQYPLAPQPQAASQAPAPAAQPAQPAKAPAGK